MLNQVNVGLIGLGTVGSGVARVLLEQSHLLEQRIGTRVVLKRICDRSIKRKRSLLKLRLPADRLTSDPKAVLTDPDIHIVVELIGGIEPARRFILEAMRRGKHVVTANKALLAQAGDELFRAADKYGVDLYFEASVAGGIPIIRSLREGLIANDINAIIGIINGTSNYILTRMRDKRLSFHEALLEAKQHGYAERDPTLDIEGHDAAHKLAILAWLGFGARVRLSDIHAEGISQVSLADIQYADELGYCIKPLAIAKQDEGPLELRVHPTLLAKSHLLANVNGVHNAVYLHGDLVGGQLFYGRGAGQNPTASAVISDIADLARNLSLDIAKRVLTYVPPRRQVKLRRMGDIETRYYLRFTVNDKPGVLGKIAGILGRQGISIASVHQKERLTARTAPVIVMTHDAREAAMRRALRAIDRLPSIKSKTVALRVEAPRTP